MHQKSDYCNYYKKDTSTLIQRNLFYALKASILIPLWIDYKKILSQLALYPVAVLIIQTVDKNVFILTSKVSLLESIRTLSVALQKIYML